MSFSLLLGDTLKSKSDATVKTVDALKDIDVVALYFSAHWCPPCRGFTPKLAELYEQVRAAGKSFEVVFVSSDKDEKSYNEYHAQHPWLALPFADRDRKAKLSAKYNVSGIPTLVLLDKEADLVTENGRKIVAEGADAYPWAPKTFDEMLGNKFIGQDGKELDRAALTGGAGRVLGLYFSAHWCPPCKGFTPDLAKRYAQLKAAGKNVEILFVSSDRSEEACAGYFAEMPWTLLPYEDRQAKADLDELFGVEGIPTLVFYDCENKKVITTEGRAAVSAESFIEAFPFHPKPVNDLKDGAAGINEHAAVVVLTESCDAATQKQVKEALNTVAVVEFAKAEDERAVGRFFEATGGEVVPHIRKNCHLGDAGDKPQVLILDLADQGGYYLPADEGRVGEVTAESLSAALEAFGAKALERKQWGQ